jgi:hypothetical protein
MKNLFLLLACAAAMALSSCSTMTGADAASIGESAKAVIITGLQIYAQK